MRNHPCPSGGLRPAAQDILSNIYARTRLLQDLLCHGRPDDPLDISIEGSTGLYVWLADIQEDVALVQELLEESS